MNLSFREIRLEDNARIAQVIRTALEEYGVARPGTVYTDPTTDDLFSLFKQERSVYFIAELNGELIGGCGVFPTLGLPKDCAEIVKLYIKKEARGLHIGFQLLEKCANAAQEMGYQSLYLETLPELDKAVSLYERCGYTLLEKPLGESGHFACSIWMLKEL
jgi:putative acetyltransferase